MSNVDNNSEFEVPLFSVANPPSASKTGRKLWSSVEECVLIEEVVAREGLLFGEMKGPGGIRNIHRQRIAGWQAVADVLNARFSQCKREGDGVKKKYYNLKQRAKTKIDTIKAQRYKTGGGPAPPSLSEAEETLAQSLEGRPGVFGLQNVIDTDDQEQSTSIAVTSVTEAEASSLAQFVTAETTCSSTERKTNSKSSINGPIPAAKQTAFYGDSKMNERKRKLRQDEATYENTLADTERIRMETVLLKLKTKYYTMKIQKEFGGSS